MHLAGRVIDNHSLPIVGDLQFAFDVDVAIGFVERLTVAGLELQVASLHFHYFLAGETPPRRLHDFGGTMKCSVENSR
jgi:hypothetical protein